MSKIIVDAASLFQAALSGAERRRIKEEGTREVYSGPEGRALELVTPEAASLYSAGTAWCIKHPKQFSGYASTGQLYVLLPAGGGRWALRTESPGTIPPQLRNAVTRVRWALTKGQTGLSTQELESALAAHNWSGALTALSELRSQLTPTEPQAAAFDLLEELLDRNPEQLTITTLTPEGSGAGTPPHTLVDAVLAQSRTAMCMPGAVVSAAPGLPKVDGGRVLSDASACVDPMQALTRNKIVVFGSVVGWGAWVSPNGNWHDLEEPGHEMQARKHCSATDLPISGDVATDRLLKDGWIRITYPSSIQYCGNPDLQVLNGALNRLCQDLDTGDVIYVDPGDGTYDAIPVLSKGRPQRRFGSKISVAAADLLTESNKRRTQGKVCVGIADMCVGFVREAFANTSVAIMLPVPARLAAEWPEELEETNGPPHFTVAYVKNVDTEDLEDLLNVVREVAAITSPIPIELSAGVMWFTSGSTSPGDPAEIAHKGVEAETAKQMTLLHWALVKALKDAEFDVSVRDEFKPHSTLEYCETREYGGPVPEGEWIADTLVVYGFGASHDVALSGSSRDSNTREVAGALYRALERKRVSVTAASCPGGPPLVYDLNPPGTFEPSRRKRKTWVGETYWIRDDDKRCAVAYATSEAVPCDEGQSTHEVRLRPDARVLREGNEDWLKLFEGGGLPALVDIIRKAVEEGYDAVRVGEALAILSGVALAEQDDETKRKRREKRKRERMGWAKT